MRNTATAVVIAAGLALSPAAQADTIYVDDDNCPGDGSEPMAQSAFSTYRSTGSQPTIVPTKVIPVPWILRPLMMRRACRRNGARWVRPVTSTAAADQRERMGSLLCRMNERCKCETTSRHHRFSDAAGAMGREQKGV